MLCRQWHLQTIYALATFIIRSTSLTPILENRITKDIFMEMESAHIRELAGDLRTSVLLSSLQKKFLKVRKNSLLCHTIQMSRMFTLTNR